MPAFCMTCGNAVEDGTKFCPTCGAPTGGVIVAPAATVSSPPPATSTAPTGMSTGLKVALMLLGGFVLLGALLTLLVFVGVWKFSQQVDVDERGGKVTIRTPKGSVTVGEVKKVSEAELGVPIYPGASQLEGGVSFEGDKGGMHTYVFKTSDTVAQVTDFYKQRIGDQADKLVVSEDGSLLTLKDHGGSDYMIALGTDDSDEKTVITITRVRKGPGPGQ